MNDKRCCSCDDYDCVTFAERDRALNKLWLAAHAIAPGREIELAEALNGWLATLRFYANGNHDFGVTAVSVLTKLGLNECPSCGLVSGHQWNCTLTPSPDHKEGKR